MSQSVNVPRTNVHESTEGVPEFPWDLPAKLRADFLHEEVAEWRTLSEAATEIERLQRGGWQPMNTFPRDGNGYLVCDARVLGGNHEVVFWDDEAKTGWCLQTSDGPAYHPATFTHWMPLPAPPEPTP